MALYKTEGIILFQKSFGEADRLLTVFSKDYGKMQVIAKGVRKVTSRKAGSLDTFNHVWLVLAQGRNLDLITEVAVKETFSRWRKNLVGVGMAYYLAELVKRLTAEGQENEAVFELLREFLGRIGKEKPKKLIRGFEEKLLSELGFGVPERLRSKDGSLVAFIEEILEGEIKSREVLRQLREILSSEEVKRGTSQT